MYLSSSDLLFRQNVIDVWSIFSIEIIYYFSPSKTVSINFFGNQQARMESVSSDLYFKTAQSELELERCYRLRFQVYCKEKRWLPSENYPDGLEIDEYDDKAVHIIALDEDLQVVGMMRILQEKYFTRLPYLDHPGLRNKAMDLPNLAELSRFVVTSSKYRYYVLLGIFRLIYQTSRQLGIDHWMFVSEPSMIRFMDRFKFYFNPICTPAKFFGGFTLIATCDIGKNEERWRTEDKEALEFNTSESFMIQPDFVTA